MPTPIKDRIASGYKPGILLIDLARAVFPPESYPRAWRYATKGGPYAWVRVLKPALRRYHYDRLPGRWSHSSYAETVWRRE